MKTEKEVADDLFSFLANSKKVHEYREAFYKATGAILKLVKPEHECALHDHKGTPTANDCSFCSLVLRTRSGCEACRQSEDRMLHDAEHRSAPQQDCCFAGLTCVVVPVLVGQTHVATLLSGHLFRRRPTEKGFDAVLQRLGKGVKPRMAGELRRHYFSTPVVSEERFQAIIEMVKIYSVYLAGYASRGILVASEAEPETVVSVKEYVQSHFEEPLHLPELAHHAGVSTCHLCKVFKHSTGMTLTGYVTRVRVERAKILLANPLSRISEVGFAAGFGSIPRFNSAFKQLVGMPPTDYRAELRNQIGA